MYIAKDLSIGQRFKKIRLEKGISQEKLAEGICSSSVVSHIETDRQYPSAHIWGKLAERLGVPVYEIMGEQEKQMETSFQLDMIRVYIEKGDFEHGLVLINEMEERESLLSHQRVDMLVCRAECLIRTGQANNAVDLLLHFIESQETLRTIDDLTMCDLYDKLGTGYFKLRDLEKAYAAYEHGYRISLRLQEFNNIAARVTHNLGITCNQLGLRQEAAVYLEKAQAYFRSISDLKTLANSFFELAIAYDNEHYLKEALGLYEGLNAIKEAYLVRQYYAYHMEAKQDRDKAIDDLHQIAIELEAVGDHSSCIFVLGRAARVCVDAHDFERAWFYIEEGKSRIDSRQQDNMAAVADFYQATALYYLKQDRFRECTEWAEKSANIFGTMGINTDCADSLEIAARGYESLGEIETALRLQKEVSKTLRGARVKK